MTIKPKVKKKKSKKLKAPALLKGPITKLACRNEVIWRLYTECQKAEKDKNAIRDIKIYLQNVDFPVSVNYKTDFLDDLKGKSIIKDYELKIEEEELPPIILEESLEPNVDLLPLTSFKELESAPKKYKAVNHAENDYVAIVKCDPQKVIKHFKNDFKRVNQKRKKIVNRKKIEDFFEKEQVLICNDLKLGLESGNATYEEVAINFSPVKQEYKLLKALMEKPNKRLGYEEICKIVFGGGRWNPKRKNTVVKRDISFIIRNIKRKLKILGKRARNKDLFFPCNGYRIVCD